MPIHLETLSARVGDVQIIPDLSDDYTKAEVAVSFDTAGTGAKTAKVEIAESSSQVVGSTNVSLDGSSGKTTFPILNPKLWWPNGQGDQPLYTVSVSLLDASGNKLDEKKTRIGIRTIKLIQRPLRNGVPGTTFMFNVNGRDIFTQGACWAPADNLLPRITKEKYYDWISLCKYNNLNMLRVWGGGIYETEDFLDACDEMGILVWHEYALACGEWPMHQEWLDNFSAEAEYQTRRLRNRACLALLCGSNEDFLLEDWMGAEPYDFSDHDGPWDDKPFPHRKIFLKLLPEICSRLAPNIHFWPSSPWGESGKDSSDLHYGDLHQWAVWHMDKPYQEYKDLSGRFVSEYGVHGFPINRTVNVYAPRPEDRHPQSPAVECHNKGQGHEKKLPRYLAENFRYSMEFYNYIYCSHLLQSEAYGYAIRDWKRKFNKGSEECSGAIIWQLNDCYPSTTWSYIDSYRRPKPAYYTIRRTNAPVNIGIERTPRSRSVDEDNQTASLIPTFEIFAHNMTPEDIKGALSLKAYDLKAGKYVDFNSDDVGKDVTLAARYNTELGMLKPHLSWTEDSEIILQATLIDPTTGKTLAKFVDWPEPYRYLFWPKDTNVKITTAPNEDPANKDFTTLVSVTANQPIKGCWLEPVYDGMEQEEDPEPLWEDNMFDIMPQETITVAVKGLRGRKVTARFLQDWEVDAPVR
jgi:beta-mannosidase